VTCVKVPFASKREADKELNKLLRKRAVRLNRSRPMECRAYECPGCGQWHLTSSAWKERRRSDTPLG
jgi:hypothetical protein